MAVNNDIKYNELDAQLTVVENKNLEIHLIVDRLMGELEVNVGESDYLRKRVRELENSFNSLRRDALVVSIREFKDIKTALPLVKKALENAEKSIENLHITLAKYHRTSKDKCARHG